MADPTYADYYLNTMREHEVGMQLGLGPTGLGKTWGVVLAINHHRLHAPAEDTRGFMYLTHRHQLLVELEADLKKINIPVAYLKSDGEVLLELAEQGELAECLTELAKAGVFKQADFKMGSELFLHWERRLLQRWQDLKAHPDDEYLKEDLNNEQRRLNKLIQTPFRKAADSKPALHKSWLKLESAWKLFPYIRFLHDPQRPVLLATIQKAVMGYFNGVETGRLPQIKKNVIFLDEIDFLEPDILNSLVQDAQLSNPVEFVATFMQNAPLLTPRFWADYPKIHQSYASKYDQILSDSKELGFAFPAVRRFFFDTPLQALDTHLTLFKVGRTILTKPFSLVPTGQHMAIQLNAGTGMTPWQYVGWLQKSIHSILTLMDQAYTDPTLMSCLFDEIWNCKNDNASGKVERYIRANHAYRTGVQYDRALEPDFAYQTGYTLFTLEQQNPLDPHQMSLTQLELSTTPEMLLVQLASNNLLFGLSATADLPRKVRCLNLEWIQSRLETCEPPLWIPVTEKEISLVEALKAQKDKKKYPDTGQPILKVFDLDEPLADSVPQQALEDLLAHLLVIGFFNPEETAGDRGASYRQERTRTFVRTLTHLALNSQVANHILFLHSFKNERRLLFADEPKLFQFKDEVEKLFSPSIQSSNDIKLDWCGKRFRLVFLNAEKAKELKDVDLVTRYDAAFMDPEVDFTLLVTQYATASNGVNLRCKNKVGEETDFQGIHLLEKRHYWLDVPERGSKDYLIKKKMLFWYGWKLYQSGEIAYSTFLSILKELSLKRLNAQHYEECPEYTLNMMALIYQSLGRMDRKWEKSPYLEVGMSRQILSIWKRFLSDPAYRKWAHHPERKRYVATFINTLQEKVQDRLFDDILRTNQMETEDITDLNRESREVIRSLLAQIEKLKAGDYPPDSEAAREVRQAWRFVREKVLRQEMLETYEFKKLPLPKLKMSDLACQTQLLQPGKRLYISDVRQHPDHQHLICQEQGLAKWQIKRQLDQPYTFVAKNTNLRHAFLAQGYVVEHRLQTYSTQSIWTPYVEQAILRGAIGEEALQLLLKQAGIPLASEHELPADLFEVVDARLSHLPWYLDFKNFGPGTLDRYALTPEDWDYNPLDNSEQFVTKVARKLQLIRKVQNEPQARLIILNLAAEPDLKCDLFDVKGKPVTDLTKADIVYVPGALNINQAEDLHPEFLRWLGHIRRATEMINENEKN